MLSAMTPNNGTQTLIVIYRDLCRQTLKVGFTPPESEEIIGKILLVVARACSDERQPIKAIGSIWAHIYRHAIAAGLTRMEAKGIAEDTIRMCQGWWDRVPGQTTLGHHKGQVLSHARRRIAEMLRRRVNPTPYEASVAWREKYYAA
jgi:hypothetical protein